MQVTLGLSAPGMGQDGYTVPVFGFDISGFRVQSADGDAIELAATPGHQGPQPNLVPQLGTQKPYSRQKCELIAEDGFDPSTSGLWAQHAPAAPLC